MTPSEAENSGAVRDAKGRLLPGHKMGRPVGSKSQFNRRVLDGLGDLTSQALAVLKEQLGQSNLKAAIFVLQRFLPEHRAIEINSTDPTAWADAMAEGEVTVAEAHKASGALKTLIDASEVRELRERLDELEHLIAESRK